MGSRGEALSPSSSVNSPSGAGSIYSASTKASPGDREVRAKGRESFQDALLSMVASSSAINEHQALNVRVRAACTLQKSCLRPSTLLRDEETEATASLLVRISAPCAYKSLWTHLAASQITSQAP